MFNKFVIIFLGSMILSGCDKIDEFTKKQSDLEERIEKLEALVDKIKKQIDSPPNETGKGLSFGSCIFENMRGVNSDLAAISVKESCLHTASSNIPKTDLLNLNKSTAALGTLYGNNSGKTGLYIHFVNNTIYTITELTIIITNKTNHVTNTYKIRWFPEPEPQYGVIGLPTDKTIYMKLSPGQSTFTLEINDKIKDNKNFFDEYIWQVSEAKGFID